MNTVDSIYKDYKCERDKIQTLIFELIKKKKLEPNMVLSLGDPILDDLNIMYGQLKPINLMIDVIEKHLL